MVLCQRPNSGKSYLSSFQSGMSHEYATDLRMLENFGLLKFNAIVAEKIKFFF